MDRPNFNFSVPLGYEWLREVCAMRYYPFSPLQPWYYTSRRESSEFETRWENDESVRLVVFASRQDTEDRACFVVKEGEVIGIAEVHLTEPGRFEITAIHRTFWDWLKAIIDDIALFAEVAAECEEADDSIF